MISGINPIEVEVLVGSDFNDVIKEIHHLSVLLDIEIITDFNEIPLTALVGDTEIGIINRYNELKYQARKAERLKNLHHNPYLSRERMNA